jgi:hypothetical protein
LMTKDWKVACPATRLAAARASATGVFIVMGTVADMVIGVVMVVVECVGTT